MSAAFASPIIVSRCKPAEAEEALSLSALAWPENERSAQLDFLRAALAKGERDLVLIVASQDRQMIGAAAGQILPGKVASITAPQVKRLGSEASAELSRRLLEQLHTDLQAQGVELAQALLPSDNLTAASRLRRGGYEHAADLLYMAAEADSFPHEPLPLPFELVPYNPADGTRLASLVDATYRGTLDCPRLDGLRVTSEVLTGYRAVGDSGEKLWCIVQSGGRDVGCLLVADHPQTRQWEIVYVALVPEVRGRGWGLELTRQAQYLAGRAGRERLVLAVDAANEPAIRMYATAGFRAWDRRAVWIKPLRGAPTACQERT